MSESSPETQLRIDRVHLQDALLQRATILLPLVLFTHIALAPLYHSAVPLASRLNEPWHIAYSVHDHVKLGQIIIHPATALAIQEPALLRGAIHIFTGLQLINWQLGQVGSEGLYLTLWWRGGDAQREDLTVFAHVYGMNNRQVALADGTPRQGKLPASLWKAQDIVRDWHHSFPPPAQDFARVEVRLYDPSTMERLVATMEMARDCPTTLRASRSIFSS